MKTLTKENFKLETSENKVLVKFGAPWCGPCRMVQPILDKLSSEFNIAEVNIDEQGELAQELGIRSVPTFLMFENGEVTTTKIGVLNEQEIRDLF